MLSLKSKNFPDIAAAENPEVYKCPAQYARKDNGADKAESEYSYETTTTYQAVKPSSSTIFKIVKNFFDKVESKLNQPEKNKLINEVTDLFTDSDAAFQQKDNDTQLQEIITNFQKLIPLSALSTIAYSDIASLFQSISIAFQSDGVTNPLEMLRCILEDTYDTMQDVKDVSSPQDCVMQSMKDVMMSMPMGQLMETAVLSQVSTTISKMIEDGSPQKVEAIDKIGVVESLMEFAEENMIDCDRDQLEDALNTMLDDIVNKIND